ncbi:MAG: hypothetical protein SFW36_04140 [Leptolyngbyaceae cyanobacterium bins.59]|nr:hypothetical protein [Leptolyngbyaceae cyanobacterium bins.59]
MKKFVCEFWASPVSTSFTPGAAEIARTLGYPYPSRQLRVEVCEGNSRERVEQWAKAIANERGWRYIETHEVTGDWMQQIKQLARSQDIRAIRICLALNERPWLGQGQ